MMAKEAAAMDKGCKIIFAGDNCQVAKKETTIAVGIRRNKLFEIKFKVDSELQESEEGNDVILAYVATQSIMKL